jgi:hypothetical protein
MPKMTGGCLCGKVRYSADAEPTFVGVCHCRDCQKYGGSAFSVVVAMPKTALSVQGATSTFDKPGDTGKMTHRSFCPACGSPIVEVADVMPDVAMINSGTLDDASWVKPAMQIYCASAQPWVALHGDMQRFDKMPG